MFGLLLEVLAVGRVLFDSSVGSKIKKFAHCMTVPVSAYTHRGDEGSKLWSRVSEDPS